MPAVLRGGVHPSMAPLWVQRARPPAMNHPGRCAAHTDGQRESCARRTRLGQGTRSGHRTCYHRGKPRQGASWACQEVNGDDEMTTGMARDGSGKRQDRPSQPGKTVDETAVVMSRIMQPTDSNSFGNVHGGSIMR